MPGTETKKVSLVLVTNHLNSFPDCLFSYEKIEEKKKKVKEIIFKSYF